LTPKDDAIEITGDTAQEKQGAENRAPWYTCVAECALGGGLTCTQTLMSFVEV